MQGYPWVDETPERHVPNHNFHILILVDSTIDARHRSGVHRTVIEAARGLAQLCQADLVRYDPQLGGLRFLDREEIDCLFGRGNWPTGINVRPDAWRIGGVFRDGLDPEQKTWLFAPELTLHNDNGGEKFARAVSQLREADVKICCVFYDMIPLENPLYVEHAPAHTAYMVELLRADLIVAISAHSGAALQRHWSRLEAADLPVVDVLPLPDGGDQRPVTVSPAITSNPPLVMLLGSVEPRKRQVNFIDAFQRARVRSKASEYRVLVIGSVHPASAPRLEKQLKLYPWLEHKGYAADAFVDTAFSQARFTAFVSDDEGFGLPIAESLAHGVPCVCANFGSMAEIAEGGGCFTIDVRDHEAVEQAVVDLCDDPAILDRLKNELRDRKFHYWRDYAAKLLQRLDVFTKPPLDDLSVTPATVAIAESTDTRFEAMAASDILGFRSETASALFAQRAVIRGWPDLLPSRIIIQKSVSALRHALEQEATNLFRLKYRQQRTARNEAIYKAARQTLSAAAAAAHRPRFLRIVISTCNRRDFTVANVNWLLSSVLPIDEEIDLVVVDGASTDGTFEALSKISDPRLRIIGLPGNPGMLGGLRVAASLMGAEYVWIVGDDDFLVPEAFTKVLQGLKAAAGVPLGIVNFSVYSRSSFQVWDRPDHLISEARPVSGSTAPTGVMPLRKAVEQNDNLLTAIYTLIWRSDVLSAAYDHRFVGPPFKSLVEAIPCTEYLLRTFASSEVYWHAQQAVAGNAHNSWSAHRPLWHGVVMPQAFALAQAGGVSPALLQIWADRHSALLDEALNIAKSSGLSTDVSGSDFGLGRFLFRRVKA